MTIALPTVAPFATLLPPAGQAAFDAWRAARALRPAGGLLPSLHDFAPHRLPREVLPWILLYRQRPDGEIVYGLAGDELVWLFGSFPKGAPILTYAEPAERERRLAVIRGSMETGRAVWFTGALLFENRASVPVGRLGLPAWSGSPAAPERAFLLIYFLLAALPGGRAQRPGRIRFDPGDVHWCPEAEAEVPSGNN